jgi:hypothetical protein
MANILDYLNSKINSFKQSVSNAVNDNQGFIQQGHLTAQPITQTINYFNPTSNAGNNFWSSPTANTMANVQKAVQNPTPFTSAYKFLTTPTYVPGISSPKQTYLQNTGPVGEIFKNTVGSLANTFDTGLKAGSKYITSQVDRSAPGLTAGNLLDITAPFTAVPKMGANIAGGLIGGGVKAIENKFNGQPITNDLGQAYQSGFEFTNRMNPLNTAVSILSEVGQGLPIVQKMASNPTVQKIVGNVAKVMQPEEISGFKSWLANRVRDAVNTGIAANKSGLEMALFGGIEDPKAGETRLMNAWNQYKQGAIFGGGIHAAGTILPTISETEQLGKLRSNKLEPSIEPISQLGGSEQKVQSSQVTQKKMPMEQPTTVLPDGTQIPNTEPFPSKTKLKVKQETLSSAGSLPQRGFAETVSTMKNLPKDVKNFLESQTYDPLTNEETMKTVSKIVQRGDSQAISFAKNDSSVNGNATAMVMLKKLIDKGRWSEVNDLIEAVGPRFTKQGQEIQILSLFKKLSPEGSIRYAQKFIDRANKANPKLGLKLTPENTQEITNLAKNLNKFPEGSRERIVATQQLLQRVTDLVPSSIGQKISGIQTMAQLLNPKTIIRNIVGNTAFVGLENTSDVVGTGLDLVTSMITGKRTKALPSLTAQGKGFLTGLKQGAEDVKLGIDTSGGVSSQFELNKKTFTGPILGSLEKAMNYSLRVPDRAAYQAAFDGSLNNQMRAAGVSNPTPDMLATAHADGLYRTFQDNSKLAEIFSGAKKLFNKIGTPDGRFGLGDFLLKYPKTPANILSRGLDYSPVGFLKGMYEAVRPLISGQPFDQKSFVESLSRGMVGTGLVSAGYILGKFGIITGKGLKDYDLSSVAQTTGQGQFKLNVDALKRFFMSGGKKQETQDGDTLVSYDWAQPTSLSIAMGANAATGGKISEGASSVIDSLQSGVDTLTGQPMVKGLTDFASNIKNKGVIGALQTAGLDSSSGFIPTLFNQFGNTTDTIQRETYNPNVFAEAKNKLVARIPGLRNSLQPKVDVFGNEKVNYPGSGLQRLADIFVNPAFVSKVKSNPAAKEVLDIYNRSGEVRQAPRVAPQKVNINGENLKPSSEQYTEYQKYIGSKTNTIFNNLLSDSRFNNLSDEEKAKLMSGLLSDINDAAKVEVFGNKMKSIPNTVKYIIALGGGDYSNSETNSGTSVESIQPPKLTGNPIIDKKLKDGYKSALENQAVKQAQVGTKSPNMDVSKVYNYVDENGAYKTVDLTPPQYPTMTGNTLVDKRLKSAYYSSINSQINDVIKLGQNGQITQDQMIQMVNDLNSKLSGSKKGPRVGKISLKRIKVKKMPKPKITKAKMSKLKTISFKSPKIKLKSPKLKLTANKFNKKLKAVSFG